MKSPLEQISNLEEVIRQLCKIDSKLDAGQIIRAYREIGKLISFFERSKLEIIQQEKSKKQDNSNNSNNFTDIDLLEQFQNLEEVIRQLHKIHSFIYAGQIIQAYGNNNKLIYILKRKLYEIS